MLDQGENPGGPLWTHGDMIFRVRGVGREPDRIVKVRRPFALLGQAADSDIPIGDQGVGARHVYLHLDSRGVYALDLVTRAGTRFDGTDQLVAWLRPGQWLEVAGRRIELLRARIDGVRHSPPPCNADLLADTGRTMLVGVSLEPRRASIRPWVLGSELVFLGRSAACGIQVRDSAVSRTHCALVRTATAAYVVDLCGQHTRIDDRPVRRASIVRDGQVLTLGSAPFVVRVEPAATTRPVPAPVSFSGGRPALVARPIESDVANGSDPPTALEVIPPDSRRSILAWMMGTIQGSQGEILRQQGDFQLAMTQLLRQIQQDNAILVDAHLSRIENVDRELARLRAELEHQGFLDATSPPAVLPSPPQVNPLPIPRPVVEPTNSEASTTWLLRCISRLENENRSAWRDFLGRFALPPRRAT